jgi:hypothetical protein
MALTEIAAADSSRFRGLHDSQILKGIQILLKWQSSGFDFFSYYSKAISSPQADFSTIKPSRRQLASQIITPLPHLSETYFRKFSLWFQRGLNPVTLTPLAEELSPPQFPEHFACCLHKPQK